MPISGGANALANERQTKGPGASFTELVADLTLSTLIVGTMLFLSAADPPLAGHTVVAGGALVAGGYVGGAIGHRHLGLAALEGLLRLRLALEWTAFLIEAFGSAGN